MVAVRVVAEEAAGGWAVTVATVVDRAARVAVESKVAVSTVVVAAPSWVERVVLVVVARRRR